MIGPQTRDEVIAWLDAREAAVIERVTALASEHGWYIDAESSGVHRLFIELDLGREPSEDSPSFFAGCRVDTRGEPSVWPMIEAQTDADCALAVAAWPSLQALAAELRAALAAGSWSTHDEGTCPICGGRFASERDGGLVGVCELAYERAVDQARPPALSDWIRACEGTGLGAPEWRHGHQSICLRWREHATVVEIVAPGGEIVQAGAYVGRWPGGRDSPVRCATPAALRAALNRIAAEAGR